MVVLKPYWNTENVFLIYELDWKGHHIRPGDPVKIKRKGSNFRFTRLVVEGSEETLEVLDMKSGKCRRFHMNQFDGPVMKRSRKNAA